MRRISVGLLALLGAAPRVAAADEAVCAVDVVAAQTLSPSWMDAVAALRVDLAKLARAECVVGTLTVDPTPSGARVVLHTVDGREAAREVARPSALEAMSYGLVVTPVSSPVATSTAPPPATTTAAARPPTPAVERQPSTRFGLDVSLDGGVRIAFPTSIAMPDFAFRADVRANDWIVTATVRVAPTAAQLNAFVAGYAYNETSLALGVGRRFRIASTSLDLTAQAALVLMSEDGDAPVEEGGAPSELRVGACVRWLLFAKSRIRPNITLEGEIAPTALATPLRVGADLPPLPTWTLGLRVGITGELL